MKTKILPTEAIKRQFEYMNVIKAENDRFALENGFRKGAFVMTFGCQQNEADSEKIAGMAESMGYEIISSPENAYLIVVNTCAIREHAELKALSTIGQYKHIKQKNPELVIAVCGCMVTQEHRVNDINFCTLTLILFFQPPRSIDCPSFFLQSSLEVKDFIVLTRITQLRRVCRSGEKATIELGYRLCTDAIISAPTV